MIMNDSFEINCSASVKQPRWRGDVQPRVVFPPKYMILLTFNGLLCGILHSVLCHQVSCKR